MISEELEAGGSQVHFREMGEWGGNFSTPLQSLENGDSPSSSRTHGDPVCAQWCVTPIEAGELLKH